MLVGGKREHHKFHDVAIELNSSCDRKLKKIQRIIRTTITKHTINSRKNIYVDVLRKLRKLRNHYLRVKYIVEVTVLMTDIIDFTTHYVQMVQDLLEIITPMYDFSLEGI